MGYNLRSAARTDLSGNARWRHSRCPSSRSPARRSDRFARRTMYRRGNRGPCCTSPPRPGKYRRLFRCFPHRAHRYRLPRSPLLLGIPVETPKPGKARPTRSGRSVFAGTSQASLGNSQCGNRRTTRRAFRLRRGCDDYSGGTEPGQLPLTCRLDPSGFSVPGHLRRPCWEHPA